MMDYAASLIGSDDVTLLSVQLQPEKILDIGHVDIFTAGNAKQEFWHPVLEQANAFRSTGCTTPTAAVNGQ